MQFCLDFQILSNLYFRLLGFTFMDAIILVFLYSHSEIKIREEGDIGLFIKIVPKVLKYHYLIRLLIIIVDHHWGCTSIYQSMCYPCRSLYRNIERKNEIKSTNYYKLAATPLASMGSLYKGVVNIM